MKTAVAPNDQDRHYWPCEDVFAAGLRNHHISNTAYPIAHESTWGSYRKAVRSSYPEFISDAFSDVGAMSLYVHIPFCEVRCAFCEYTVVSGKQLVQTDVYRDALLREIAGYGALLGQGPAHPVRGIDIGGGTPAFVPADDIARILGALRAQFDCGSDGRGGGISVETTPRIAAAEPEKLRAWYASGIERVSMGIQVIQPDLLKILARDGNGVEHHQRAVEHIRAAGFQRFNVDVMYGFADQSLQSLAATMAHTVALNPEYITLYRMRYKLTRISHQAPRVDLAMVKAHATLAREMLEAAGYHANPGKNTFVHRRVTNPCDVGTSAYLRNRVIEGTPYLGLGLGAQSFTHRSIAYNDGAVGKNLTPYLRAVGAGEFPIQDFYLLPPAQMMAKFVAVAFYFGEIDRHAFRQKFALELEEAFPEQVRYVKTMGLMQESTGQGGASSALSLTELGAKNFSGVIALFFAPSVQKYLLERDPDQATDMARHRDRAERVSRAAASAVLVS